MAQEIGGLASKREGGGRVHIQDLPAGAGGKAAGETPLLHFVYKSPMRSQYVSPAWTFPADDPEFRLVLFSPARPVLRLPIYVHALLACVKQLLKHCLSLDR